MSDVRKTFVDGAVVNVWRALYSSATDAIGFNFSTAVSQYHALNRAKVIGGLRALEQYIRFRGSSLMNHSSFQPRSCDCESGQ